jgi:hypothetical protein
VFKSQEPSLLMLSLDPFPLFHPLLWHHHISNKITKPSRGYGKYRDILNRNDKHAPCNCSHDHNAASNTFVACYICQKLAPKLGQLQKWIQDLVLMRLNLSSGHFVYQRYQKNSYADQPCHQASCKVSKMVQKQLIYFTLFNINHRFICEITLLILFIIFHI